MNKKEGVRLMIGTLVVLAIMMIVICTIAIVMPVQRTSKATTYDLECVAGRSRRPLEECKE